MGIADRHIEYREKFGRGRFTLGQPGNALVAIIIINIVFFLLILMTRVFYLYANQGQDMTALNFDASEWFALPSNINLLLSRPWTLFSFMFSHGGLPGFSLLITMVSNMLWLYAFGYILQGLSGNKHIFPVYIYGSLTGAVFYLAAVYLIPALHTGNGISYLMGANTGNTALAVAVTVMAPNYRFFRHIGNGLPVWTLTVLFLVFNLVSAVGFNSANSFAVLGGAVAGLLFVIFLNHGLDGSNWMIKGYTGFINLFNPVKKNETGGVKEKIFYNTGNRAPFKKTANVTEQRVDEILDKINQKGYQYLSEEEKLILKKASEE